MAPQQVTAWWRDARKGRLVLPVEDAALCAALVSDEPLATVPAPSSPGMTEIEAGSVGVRMARDASAARVAAIAAARLAGWTASW